jgi:Uma2 family endonuclease
MARPPAIEAETAFRLVLNMRSVCLTDDQFFRLCSDNRDFRIEMTATGELIIMSPTNMETGRKNAAITARLFNWTRQDGSGECFDSSSEFSLPNGAKRSADASWILKSRWNRLSEEEKNKFSPICPDFVIELRSPSDRLPDAEAKMEEYIANGARLGWLLDPIENRAVIYRSGHAPERVDDPTIISGDPVLPGFRFDFREISRSGA